MEKALRKKSFSIFLVIATMLVTAIAFFACDKKTPISVDFVQGGQIASEIILSKDKPENLADYIETKNIEKSQITFEISDKNIYTFDNGLYTFTESAHTMIFAKLQKEVLASAELVVKAKFPAPSTMTIDDDGILHWNESVTIENGQPVTAQSYTLTINGQAQPSVSQPNFDLQQYAIDNDESDFSIYVQADGLKYVDASERQTQPFVFHLPKLDQVSITSFTTNSSNVNLQWGQIDHAFYNIYLDGINLAQNLAETTQTIDFAMVESGEEVEVTIEAVAKGYIPSKKTIAIKKLETPEITYSKESGSISWVESENKVYLLTYTNLSSQSSGSLTLSTPTTSLDTLERGIYRISVIAQGSQSAESENDLYYANSNVSQEQTVAKLQIEAPTYSIDGTTLSIHLSEDDYIENYTLYYGDQTLDWNTKNQGLTLSVDIGDLEPGEQTLKLVARPTLENGSVKAYPKEGVEIQDEVTQVLNSKEIPLTVYVLDQFGDVTHTLSGDNDGQSNLTFESIKDATNYKVTINDENEKTFEAQEGETQTLDIGDLSSIEPQDSKYIIVIEAYRNDNHSVNSKATKTLTILEKAEKADEQTNGYFAWNVIDHASYYYEIYQTDKDYQCDFSGEPCQTGSGETIDGIVRNDEVLSFGYYKIRVYVRSGDNNNDYLAADFKDKTQVLEEGFYVYEQIATPTLKYEIDSSTLTINTVEYAYEYQISINGEPIQITTKNEGSQAGNQVTYQFKNGEFNKEGTYTIKVVAKAGEQNDATLHTNSAAAQIDIIRLPQPTLTSANIELNGDDVTLVLSKPEHCKEVKLWFDNTEQILNGDLRVDISDKSPLLAKIEYVAEESGNDTYYLGNENSINVKRLSTPTNLQFNDGVMTFSCTDHQLVDYYIVELALNCVGDAIHAITTQADNQSFNLQEFLSTQTVVETSQIESVTVKVIAYKADFVDGDGTQTFYIPSHYAQTTDSKTELKLERMVAPIVTYDKSKNQLSWEKVGEEGTTYAVYIDGILQEENITSTNFTNWEKVDLLTEKEIYVIATNTRYLTFDESNKSNIIYLKKLSAPDNLYINENQALLHTDEDSRIEKVVFNSNGDNADNKFQTGGMLSFEISTYAAENNHITIQYISVSQIGDHYYVDSDEVTFNLTDLATKDLTVSVGEGKISWNELANGFAPISYTITISGDNGYTKQVSTKKTEYSLDADDLISVTTGKYALKVVATCDPYTLSVANTETRNSAITDGYYGKKESVDGSISKLAPVGDITVTVKDGEIEGATDTQNKVAFTAILEFENLWKDEGVYFEVYVNDGDAQICKVSDTNGNYKIKNSEGKYQLEIPNTEFIEGENTIRIIVKSEKAITSIETAKKITRYGQVTGLQIDKDGVVTFDGECKNYIVSISFDGQDYVSQEITSNTADLMEKFGDHHGAYTIEVAGYDQDNEFLPSVKVAQFEGYRLAGINSVSITENGEIELELSDKVEIDEGIIFEAKLGDQSREFTPRRKDGSSTFVYSMIEFVRDFNISSEQSVSLSLNVRKENNVSAKAQTCNFEYKIENEGSDFARGSNLADDYFKFGEHDGTTAFNLQIQYFDDESYAQAIATETIVLKATDQHGYWIEVTDEKGKTKYFAKTIPSELQSGAQQTPCYAISINEILKNKDSLFYKISFSRISKENETMVQHSEKTLSFEKLAPVGELTLNNGVLCWEKSGSEKADGYYVYFESTDEPPKTFFRQTKNLNLDLTQVKDIAPGSTNNLSVVAVSQATMQENRYIIASERSTNKENTAINKLNTPAKIVVKDGKLLFDSESVKNSDLLKAIKDNYSLDDEKFLEAIENATLTNIFTLKPSEFEKAVLRLRFEGDNVVYTATIRAIDLLPSLSSFEFDSGDPKNYLEAFNTKWDNLQNPNSEIKLKLQAFHDIIQNVDGVADDEMLFDDFGETIPAGNYNLRVQQIGSDENWILESDLSENPLATAVTRAPEISLDSKEGENKQTHYLVKFKPVDLQKDQSQTEEVSTYTVRMIGDVYTYFFTIKKNAENNGYKLTAATRKNLTTETAVTDIDLTLEQDNEFLVIDVTELLKYFKSDSYQQSHQGARFIEAGGYDFVIYAQGNNYAINSKNEMVTVNLLGLNAQDIHLEEGELYWTTQQQFENLTSIVKYSRNDLQGEQKLETEIPFVNGRATLTVPDNMEGYFKYIVIYIKGGAGPAVLNVDSDSYLINNVFKQKQPDVSVAGNYFTLPSGTTETEPNSQYYTNNYKIENNANADAVRFSSAENGKNQYWPTTENASEYYITRLGNSVNFEVEVSKDGNADYVLNFKDANTNACILSSDSKTYYAKMIKAISGLQTTEQGDIAWTSVVADDKLVDWGGEQNLFDSFKLQDNQILVYKVSVYSGEEIENATFEKDFYTTKTIFDTILLSDLAIKDDTSIIFKVAVQIFEKVNNETQLTTLEGDHLKSVEISVNVSQNSQAKEFVLAGKEVVLSEVDGQKIKQATAPIEVTTKAGQLVWKVVDETLESGVYDATHKQYYSAVEKKGTDLTSVPNLDYKDNSFKLQAYTFGGKGHTNLIKSKAVTAKLGSNEQVYKLPDAASDDFTITQDAEKIVISFKNLIDKKNVNGRTDCYIIKLTVNTANEQIELYSKDTKLSDVNEHKDFVLYTSTAEHSSFNECNITGQITAITCQTLDYQTSQNIMTINGEAKTFDNLIYGGNFNAEWDSSNYRFNMSADDDDLIYEIVLNYQDKQIETAEFSGEIYEPKQIGKITGYTLRARKANGLYTEPKTSTQDCDYNIFAGGLGTSESPYKIQSADQFKNMKYRNTADQYFELGGDFELTTENGYVFVDDFLANLDGKGHTITATISPASFDGSLQSTLATAETQNQTVTFNEAGAIFKQIGSVNGTGKNGTISNLNLKTTFNYSATSSSHQLLAGLALYNYGKISGVTITQSTTSCQSGVSIIAQAGLVAHNNGTIVDCKNSAAITINAVSSDVIFAGLVLENNISSGGSSMTRCFNEGQINISLNNSNNNSAWVSGVVINSHSTLSQSGNDGDITVNGNGSISRKIVCGVCLDSSGTIEYCFNNGTLTAPNSTLEATNSIGGVAYILSDGSEQYLVDTAGNRIAAVCKADVDTQNNNYTNGNESTENLQTQSLDENLNQSCGDGHSLVIKDSKAKIVESATL